MQFSTKFDGFEQNDSQGSENSYNSYEQYPLEKFLIFTIYQNYTLALSSDLLLLKQWYTILHYALSLILLRNMFNHYDWFIGIRTDSCIYLINITYIHTVEITSVILRVF